MSELHGTTIGVGGGESGTATTPTHAIAASVSASVATCVGAACEHIATVVSTHISSSDAADSDIHAAVAGEEHSSSSSGGHHNSNQDLPLLFLFSAIGAGALLKHMSIYFKIPLPYTVLVLILGALLGSLHLPGFNTRLNTYSESLEIYANMDPHMVLLVFLPALIFESAFTTNFHIIRREMGQALLLAGPGVLISTGLVGVVVKYMFDYNWDWTTSLMVGAALSATDPVAVVALLREIGASKRLATLIEAESLLNDGTAFVLFLIFRDDLIGNSRTPAEAITYLVRLSVGGVALGIAVAVPAVIWLKHIFNNAAIETSITVAVAYLTFWMAENTHTNVQVSGVLAVVSLGLYLSKNKTCISPDIEPALHHVWELVAYFANTLIFFISGVIVAFKVFGNEHGSLAWSDFGYLILLYIMLHVIRTLTVLILAPLMRRMGYGLNWRSATILVYGGLRGAVGLVLGLIVELEEDIPQLTRDRVMFHVAGIVLLTLIINGTTCGRLLHAVKLTKQSRASKKVFERACEHLINETAMLITSLKHHKHYSGANWAEIQSLLPEYSEAVGEITAVKHHEEIEVVDRTHGLPIGDGVGEKAQRGPDSDGGAASRLENFRKGGNAGQIAADAHRQVMKERAVNKRSDKKKKKRKDDDGDDSPVRSGSDSEDDEHFSEDLKLEITHRFLSAMKACYWHQFEEGMTTRHAVNVLIEAAETALDIEQLGHAADEWATQIGGQERQHQAKLDEMGPFEVQWSIISHHFYVPTWMTKLQMWFPWLGNMLLYNKLAFAVELATGFVMASESLEEIEKLFPEFGEFSEVTFSKDEVHKFRKHALEMWFNIQKSFPEVYRSIQTKHAAQFILTKEKHTIDELYKSGILEERETMEMQEMVERSIYSLDRRRLQAVELSDRRSILAELDFYHLLDKEGQDKLVHCDLVVTNPDTTVYVKEEASPGVLAIVRGMIDVEHDDNSTETFAAGSMAGIWNLLTESGHLGTAISRTYVESIFIPRSLVLGFMKDNQRVSDYLWRQAAASVIKSQFLLEFCQESKNLQSHMFGVYVSRMCAKATHFDVKRTDEKVLSLSAPILLMTGSVVDLGNTHVEILAPAYLHANHSRKVAFTADSQVLQFRNLRKLHKPKSKSDHMRQKSIPRVDSGGSTLVVDGEERFDFAKHRMRKNAMGSSGSGEPDVSHRLHPAKASPRGPTLNTGGQSASPDSTAHGGGRHFFQRNQIVDIEDDGTSPGLTLPPDATRTCSDSSQGDAASTNTTDGGMVSPGSQSSPQSSMIESQDSIYRDLPQGAVLQSQLKANVTVGGDGLVSGLVELRPRRHPYDPKRSRRAPPALTASIRMQKISQSLKGHRGGQWLGALGLDQLSEDHSHQEMRRHHRVNPRSKHGGDSHHRKSGQKSRSGQLQDMHEHSGSGRNRGTSDHSSHRGGKSVLATHHDKSKHDRSKHDGVRLMNSGDRSKSKSNLLKQSLLQKSHTMAHLFHRKKENKDKEKRVNFDQSGVHRARTLHTSGETGGSIDSHSPQGGSSTHGGDSSHGGGSKWSGVLQRLKSKKVVSPSSSTHVSSNSSSSKSKKGTTGESKEEKPPKLTRAVTSGGVAKISIEDRGKSKFND